MFKLQCVKLMYKKLKNTLHSYHCSRLTTNHEITQTNTRQKYDVYIERHKNNLSKINSINYKVGTPWNDLDYDIKQYAQQTLPTFNKHVKKSYISQYSDVCNIPGCYSCKNK